MATFDENNFPLEEKNREEIIAKAFDPPGNIGEFVCQRQITPLVMRALQGTNNPIVTGSDGFREMGIPLTENGAPNMDARQLAIAMLLKTAEIVILLTCSREDLKLYACYPDRLIGAAVDEAEKMDFESMEAVATFMTQQLELLGKVQTVPDESDKKPETESIEKAKAGGNEPAPIG